MLRIGLIAVLLLTFFSSNGFAQRPFAKQPPKKASDFFSKDERPEAPLLVFDVYEIQVSLNLLGFNIGTPDGEMGPKTQAALTQAQQTMGITAQDPPTRQFLLDLRQQLRAKLPEILVQSKTPDVATLRRTLVGKTAFLHFYHRPWPREERLLRYHATDGRVYQYIPLEKYSASYVYTFEPGTTCLTSDRGIKQCVGVRTYRDTMFVLGKDGAVIALYSMIKEGDIGEAVTFHAVQSREAAENMANMKAILRFAWEMVVAEERAKAKSSLPPSHPCSGIEETHMGTKCRLTHPR